MSHPIPFNEDRRLEALVACGVLDTPPEPAFDQVATMARGIFNAPVALVSLVDRNRQWFKARDGVDAAETERAVAFCAHAIMSDELLIVADALADPRFQNNPLVVEPPHIRAYFGAPIVTQAGLRLGTVCVIDMKPRPEPQQAQIVMLDSLAQLTAELLDSRMQAALAAGEVADPADGAERAKREFLALMAHELRTPLNAILGFSDGNLRLDVRDNGRGMDAETREAATAPFAVGDQLLRRRTAGLGLGLPLTARLAAMHGGRLVFEPGSRPSPGDPPRGTCATVVFPAWRLLPPTCKDGD